MVESFLDPYRDPIFLIPFVTLMGLFVGSFLNVVIHRLPRMMELEWMAEVAEYHGEPAPTERLNLAVPRSRCPQCGHLVSALENIPVISYLMLRGRCKGCGTPISKRYPGVEILTAALSGYSAWHFGFGLALLGALLFLWAMVSLTFIDLDTMLLPDKITLPLLWIGLIFNLAGTYADPSSAVLGAVAGYLALWLVFWGFKLATGKEGMGYGDFKLLGAIGAWLGWQMLPLTILFSSIAGAIASVWLVAFRQHQSDVPIPFGPYLAVAGITAMFWGDSINSMLNLP